MKIDHLFAARATKATVPVHALRPNAAKKWLAKQAVEVQAWATANDFKAFPGRALLIPAEDGTLESVLFVLHRDRTSPILAARLPGRLPKGRYEFKGLKKSSLADALALGWALAEYRYTKYTKSGRPDRRLVWPKAANKPRVTRLAEATFLVRDMITTPANDMGPAQIESQMKKIAKKHSAQISVVRGKSLLEKNWPAVHAVGRAADEAPRLIDLRWGRAKDPKVTLVGKGVTFDSGGLDLKSASNMLLMKKDMGGSAHVIGLAHALMAAKLPIRLRVLVPAVENAVSGNAFRPLDVLQTRKGITIEVGNTDAEGRLILSDALHEACSEKPEMVIDFATLTGAARVALGLELPALFSNDDALADDILAAGEREHDEAWRLPLYDPYDRFLESRVADVSNTSSSRYGGAITAALFLRRFIDPSVPWAHIDLMAYNTSERIGHPKGGEAMVLRAVYSMIEKRYG